jgi:Putative adhesin
MPTFETREPISVTVDLGVGDVRIAASDRTDTSVEVRPSDPARRVDVTAAAQTRVEFANGRLVVRAPKGWRQWTTWRGHESIEVEIGVPVGSRIGGEVGVAAVRCTGRLGECRLRAGVGDIRIDEAASVELRTGAGEVTLDRVEGTAEVKTGSGTVGIAAIEGTAVVRNGNGDTWIGEVTGDVRVNAGNGSISIDRSHAGVVAKTANGHVRLGQVERGAVVAQSAFGTIEVGVRDGVAAWLDLDTKFGNVQSDLDAAGGPEAGEGAVEIHAHTSMGDVTIRRSIGSHAGREGS